MDAQNSETPKRGGVAYRSKLLPYTKEIAAWQREEPGKSYPEIARLLKEKYGLTVHRETINAFVLVRARRKKPPLLPAEYLGSQPTPLPAASPGSASSAPQGTPSSAMASPAPASVIPRRTMLPAPQTKHYDRYGKPVEPPPDPNKFRAGNL